jgi:hypothetical protein
MNLNSYLGLMGADFREVALTPIAYYLLYGRDLVVTTTDGGICRGCSR